VSAIDPTLRTDSAAGGSPSSDRAGSYLSEPAAKPAVPAPLAALVSVFEAYPILALTDLPVVVLRGRRRTQSLQPDDSQAMLLSCLL
jgi:hypothetical protein